MGSVAGRTVLLVDDLVASGGTLVRAADACRRAGARRVIAIATHGAFTSGAASSLSDPALDEVIITNSNASERLDAPVVTDKLSVVDAAGLIAEAVRRLHEDGSLVDLLEVP